MILAKPGDQPVLQMKAKHTFRFILRDSIFRKRITFWICSIS